MSSTRHSLVFIFITIAIDAIGLGIVLPALPDVVRKFISGEAEVSRVYGYFIATYALMQFASSPLLGSLSDRYGRRPILLISLAGAAIDYLFMAFAPTLPLLFLGRVISGVSGASYTVASAYIADVSDDSNRSKNFGLVGAGFGIGFITGPALGGLLGSYGPEYPFLAAGFVNLLNFLFGYFVLPESLPPEKRRYMSWSGLNPMGSLRRVFALPGITALIFVWILIQLAGHTHPSIWTLYTEHRFGWTVAEVGMSLALVGLLSALSQGFLTGPLVRRLGEIRTVLLGACGEMLSFFFIAIAPTGMFLCGVLAISSIFWACQPALQSLISRQVPSDQQGELQGTLMSLSSLMAIVNPLVVTSLFAVFADRSSGPYIPGSPYFFASILMLSAAILAALWMYKGSPANQAA